MTPEDQIGMEQPESPERADVAGSGAEAPAVPSETPVQQAPESASTAAPEEPQGKVYYRQERGLGIQSLFTVVIFTIFVITFIVQAFQIPSGSMENTLLIGDFLLVDKLHFAGDSGPGKALPYGKIERGDIVVFYYPVDPRQFLVKRVIGVPGDRIRLRSKIVYVNGVAQHESYVIHRTWIPDPYRDNFPAFQPNSP